MTAQSSRRFMMRFVVCEEAALIRTEFTHEDYAPPPGLVTFRGKYPGANPGAKPIQWSPAVRALTGYLVRCAAWSRRELQEVPNKDSPCDHNGSASAKYPCLKGVRPSAASSVLDALNAKTNWICDMFGFDSEGTPNLRRLLSCSNTATRPGEDIILRLNEKRLCPCRLQVEVGSDQVNEPQALDNLAELIDRTCRPKGSRSGFRITLKGDLDKFLQKHGPEKLRIFLAELGVRDVQVIRVESGSVKLTLSLPEDQAERLFWLADSGALDRFGLLGFQYVLLEHEVAATIPGFDLEGCHSYLVQRARFLLGDPRVPAGLDAEELASETLRSYGTAETALSHDVTRAEQLACLEKIQDRLLVDSLQTWNVPPGEVHSPQQEPDPWQAATKVPTSGESSGAETPPVEGTRPRSGIGQLPAGQAPDPPTADLVPAGDTAPPNLPGYEVLKPPIGERWPKMGGMGVVWRVRDLQFKRLLAVKVMRAESADARWVRLFLREARITAQLAHPSIVPVHSMGRLADGRPYYTMKLVEGKTLAEILQAEPDVASRRTELLQVFARVCEALAFAHRKGVIHLDLKPSNVMVGAHREVQVMDWGLAKVLDESDEQLGAREALARVHEALAFAYKQGVIHRDLKPSNVLPGAHGDVLVTDWGLAKLLDKGDDQPGVAGTWPYMSREQANGRIEEVDRRTDVFGLGAMLCAILTGKPPYVGPAPEEVKRQACEADLAGAYAELGKCGADAELIALARACLSAEPNDRPPDASAVEVRLTGYLASVQERLHQAKVAEAEARARAKEEERTRRLAEEKADAEQRARKLAEENEKQAKDAWRRMLRLMAGLGCALLALVAASLFAWWARDAKEAAERDRLAVQQAREAEKRQNAIDRALTDAMSGDLDAAGKAIAEAEQAGASTGQVHMLRGQIALHRGQSGEAIRHLEEAVRLLPESVAARGMLAAAHASDGNWELYDKALREIAQLTPVTPEDFLFKGYAEAYLEPEPGLQTIKQAFDRRPMMSIALLLRAEVRAMVAQDTDDLDEAEGAVQDAKYAKELLHDNPTALWVSLEAHLAKAGVHEHRAALHQRRAELDQRRAELDQRRAELELAGKDANALKAHTALPEAVVYRWTYFREVGREEEVLDELRLASEKTDHVYVTFCCALTLYRRGRPGDFEEALRVLERRPRTYNNHLLPFVLAEHDYPDKHGWPARARKASEDYAASAQDGLAIMDTQRVLCLLGKKGDAVEASKALLKREDLFYTLRREPILRCVRYNAGELSADELLRLAGRSQYDQCLAHYYIAMTKLAEGDREGAKEHLDKAVKTRAWGWGEYDMSWVFLSRLEKDPTWPPWIPKEPGR
jgi:serine/threonine protein kinase